MVHNVFTLLEKQTLLTVTQAQNWSNKDETKQTQTLLECQVSEFKKFKIKSYENQSSSSGCKMRRNIIPSRR